MCKKTQMYLQKNKIKKAIYVLLILHFFSSCDNSNSSKEIDVYVPNETLIVSSKGKLLNFNLESKKISWEYTSKEDVKKGLNRNLFSFDNENIYLPFESGRFISAKINSGKINWIHAPHALSSSNEISLAYTDEDGEIQTDENSSENIIFMSQPLIYKDLVYISSCKRDFQRKSNFYIINKMDGNVNFIDENSTFYNFFKPVESNSNIYVTSAVYLDMHYKEGTFASNGMYVDSAFENPLYIQIQSNKNSLFFGDEIGVIYALATDKIGLAKGGDISDSSNNFIDRTDLFEWKYKTTKYNDVANFNTELTKDFYIVNLRSETDLKDAIIALNIENGKEEWIYEHDFPIENWQLAKDKITGFSKEKIFMIDLKGKLIFELEIANSNLAPISNIERNKKNNLVYLSLNGIVEVDLETKKTELIIPYVSKPNDIEKNQIKYFQ